MSGAILADQQAELRDVVFGNGTSYCWVNEVMDWWGYDKVRTQDLPRQSSHGVHGGRDLLDADTITGQVLAQATSKVDLSDLIDAFLGNWTPSSVDIGLRANMLGETRVRFGRPRRARPGTRTMTRYGPRNFASIITFQFDALDPVLYSDDVHSAATAPPGAGTGITLPVTIPFTIPAGSSSGILGAYNAGTLPTPWTARLDGPLVNPTIQHIESGSEMQFNANGGLSIASGEYVLLDSVTRSVLYDGVADRRFTLLLGAGWFDLAVGTNTVRLTADSGTGTLTLNWRDAYQ